MNDTAYNRIILKQLEDASVRATKFRGDINQITFERRDLDQRACRKELKHSNPTELFRFLEDTGYITISWTARDDKKRYNGKPQGYKLQWQPTKKIFEDIARGRVPQAVGPEYIRAKFQPLIDAAFAAARALCAKMGIVKALISLGKTAVKAAIRPAKALVKLAQTVEKVIQRRNKRPWPRMRVRSVIDGQVINDLSYKIRPKRI